MDPKELVKALFLPSDIALMEEKEAQLEQLGNTGPEMSYCSAKRQNLFDPEDMMRAGLGSKVTDLIIERIKQGLTANLIVPELLDDPMTRQMLEITRMESGNVNLGGLGVLLTPLYYKIHKGRYFVLRDHLNEQILNTNIGRKTPVTFMRAPFPNMYIEFGEKRIDHGNNKIWNPASGYHICDGVYIHEYTIENPIEGISPATGAGLNLDPDKPVRVMNLMFTGSQLGKENIMDDASQEVTFFFQNEDMTVEELIEQHFQYYFNLDFFREYTNNLDPEAAKSQSMGDKEAEFVRWGVDHLAKVLLYINSEQCVQEDVRERTELLKRLERVAPKKQGKLRKQLQRASDRIYLGDKTPSQDWMRHSERGSIKTHWRRGHFRDQPYGEGRSKIRNIWIAPMLIGSGQSSDKTYVVK